MKRGVTNLSFTGRYERTALFNVWHAELRTLADPTLWGNRLEGRLQECPEFAADQGFARCQAAKRMVWGHMTYCAAEVLLVEDSAPCFIEGACRFSGGAFAGERFALIVTAFTGGVAVTSTATRWHMPPASGHLLWMDEGRHAEHAALWDFEDEQTVLVISY